MSDRQFSGTPAGPVLPPAVMPTVVVLDDQSTGRLILAEVIKGIDRRIHIVMFSDPVEAIDYVRKNPVDLVLTDFKMPVLDGVETIRQLRLLYTYEQLPIVMTTVVSDREVRHSAFEAGATDFLIRPVDPIECRARCQNLLNLRQQYLIISNHALALEQRVTEVTRELRLREVETLVRLARASDLRDAVTGAHLKRMAKYSGLIARRLGLSEEEAETIELAAPMHDIGKICMPDAVMHKRDLLNAEEMAIMQRHAHIGHDILKDSPSRFLQAAAIIALYHHERFDGSGYPFGLAGVAIPLAARIVALADVFDALTSARPYKAPWEWTVALDFLVAQKGRHFDPELVDVFIRHADEAAEIYRSLLDPAPI
ncbi:MAG: two-component system response regulator RpfG [Bradyrhizobium sp.]|jgi:two-component system response regulator RpfG